MGKIPAGKYSGIKDSTQGTATPITTGKMADGGGKLGSGGSLKKMMVWHDKGAKSAY